MNMTTRIQIQFSEPETPLPIPVRPVTAVAVRLSRAARVELNDNSGHFMKVAGSNRRPVELEQFIARIRRVLQKRGIS
jgi:hypothetical protein